MGTRTDYLNDPNAPEPNSLVPSVNMIVVDDRHRILLMRRTDNGNWSLPGGAIDLGESVSTAAKRETLEETGIRADITGISGIYSDPGHVIEYSSNGEVRQEFTIILTGRPISGELTTSDESSHVEWVSPEELEQRAMHPSMRKRIADYLAGGPPHLD
jgi:8-oxo-dGTP pyrophosphatase MutT (NUDIX family)